MPQPQKTPASAKRYKDHGCRADTVLGALWLCTEQYLVTLRDTTWDLHQSGDLKIYIQRTMEMRKAEAEEESEVKRYTIENKIARLGISGPLTKHPTSLSSLFGGTAYMQIREDLREIRQLHQEGKVAGLFLEVDSNGGTAEGCPEAAEAIRKTAAVMPVWAHAEDKANSGALWLATQALKFTAGPMASVGSQGTALRLWDSSEKVKDSKLKPVIIATGPFKMIGAEGVEITAEQRAELERYVAAVNKPFKDAIVTARKLTHDQATDVATARVYVGEQAQQIGLIDAVLSADDAFEKFQKEIKTGVAKRGPTPVLNNPAAPRSTAMALTAQQLEAARKLPGAANIDAENADVTLLGVASTLNQELTELKPKLGKVIPDDVLQARLEAANERVDLLVEKGRLTTAQADIMKKGFVLTDGKPNPVMFQPNQDGSFPYTPFIKAVGENKPNGVTQPVTGAQPVTRDEPGNPDDKDKPMTAARRNELRSHVGLPPLVEKVN